MGRRGGGAGGPARGKTGIVLEFAKPTNQPSASSAVAKKGESSVSVKPLPRSSSSSPIFADEGEKHYEKCSTSSPEKESVQELVNYWSSLTQRRKDLYNLNKNPNYEEFEALRRAKKLDATLKRCSAFVKKLKNCSGQQAEIAEKEAEALNLTKYLSEICVAVTDTRLKDRNQILGILSICSKIHQRYQEFAGSLLEVYKGKFSGKSIECDWNVLGADLRLVTEFLVCGILGDEVFPLIQNGLRQLVASRDTNAHMSIMLSYVKEFSLDVVGIFPKCVHSLCETFAISEPSSDLVNPLKRLKIKQLVNEYMNNVCCSLTKLHDELNKSQLICRKLLKTKGEVFKDREDIHKDLVSNFERLHTISKKLAFYTDTCLPELQELPPDDDDDDIPNIGADVNDTETVNRATFFDDEETRSFYQDLPDLTKYLTNAAKRENTIILEQQAAAVAAAEANLDEESEIAELQAEDVANTNVIDPEPEPDVVAASSSIENLVLEEEKPPPKYAEYISGLKNCVNRNMIDDAADLFMANFNNKPNRKRLIKELCHIPRQRVDLLPLWARMVAILNPVVPEVGAEVVDYLKKELWILLKRCHPTFIENKLKITRFIAELVNFEIVPAIDAFNCLRRLLANFAHHELEMSCAFVSCCGRYLYKNPGTKRRMKLYMELMQRKRQAKALDPRYSDLVEQAFYAVFPPVESRKKKTIPVLEAFLEEHIHQRLSRKTIDTALRYLRSLDLSNPKTFKTALKIFTQPWKIASNKLGITCSLLSRYEDYQPNFVNQIGDTVMAQVTHGLAHINILNNQFMVSLINYVCDLFCYQIYSCETILQLMYALISNGVSTNYKKPSPMDPPRSSFRLRLVTVLLKGCGDYFLEDKTNSTKLNLFILYLQRYMYFKSEDPIWEKAHTPYSYEPFQVVEDLIAHLFPKTKVYKTYELACEKVAKAEAMLSKEAITRDWLPKPVIQKQANPIPPPIHHLHQINECDDEIGEGESMFKWGPKLVNSSQQALGSESVAEPFFPTSHPGNYNQMLIDEKIQDEDSLMEQGVDGDEIIEATPEEGMEFDRQLGRLFTDAVVQREARTVNTDIRIPMNLEKKDRGPSGGEIEEQPSGTIAYAILLKKGNKANIKHVDVPEGSEFVKRMRDREAFEREERAQLKAKTLGIKRLQDNEEMMEQLQLFHYSKK